MIKLALISVYDKTGIIEFARNIESKGIKIISTVGTAKALKDAGIKVMEISEYTGFPEILNGRVKTLHPKIYCGILADRKENSQLNILKNYGIATIDLVVVNLYPFEEAVEKDNAREDEIIENIDIGGPAMIRAAAKNFASVSIVTNPKDYDIVLKEIEEFGDTRPLTRKKLAGKAFLRTCQYDEAIEHYFRRELGKGELLDLHYVKIAGLRYGENPHQKAAFFRNPLNSDANITNAKVLHGKQLSFNNLVDGDSALELVKEFEKPAVAVIKHNNPCGVASADNIEKAFKLAYKIDPMSSFGGVIAMNRPCSVDIANFIAKKKWFLEIVIAPKFEEKAFKELTKKLNLRLLATGPLKLDLHRRDIKKVAGGILIQNQDTYKVTEKDLKFVTKKKPTEEQIKSMLFAMIVAKHVKSNAIVLANGEVVSGIGMGQVSRVDAVYLACYKAGKRANGSVLASDGFFPFADGIEMAARHGVKAIIQPGGSIRDAEVIKRADELGLAMVFTGVRFFRH